MLKTIFIGMELSILRLFYLLGLFMEDFLFGKDMKAYTDISQSTKLAKILPIDSADMARCGGENVIMTDYISAKKKFSVCGELTITPCWSLAALINVLPDKVVIDGYRWGLSLGKKRISYLGHITYDGQLHLSVEGDNLLNACVDMISLLKEKNLI